MTPISLGIFASANQSAGATSFESIATVTVGSGGSSTIDFTSIPSTYTHLQIRSIGKVTGTGDAQIFIRFNSDTGSNYSYHQVFGEGSSALADGTANTNSGWTTYWSPNQFGPSVTDILDYANTNKYKTVRTLGGFDNNTVNGLILFRSASWRNTNAISSISIFPDGSRNFVQYSHFALYGCKSA